MLAFWHEPDKTTRALLLDLAPVCLVCRTLSAYLGSRGMLKLRLWFASAAYVLMHALRRLALAGTALSRACAHTIRLKLLKIGAVITVSVRRVRLAMSEACPYQREFIAAFHALGAAAR